MMMSENRETGLPVIDDDAFRFRGDAREPPGISGR
jgi:hypothetical protein